MKYSIIKAPWSKNRNVTVIILKCNLLCLLPNLQLKVVQTSNKCVWPVKKKLFMHSLSVFQSSPMQHLIWFCSVESCWSLCADDFHILVLNCRAFTGLNKNVWSHISARLTFLFQWSVQMVAAGPQSAGTRLLQEIRAYCSSVPGEVCDRYLMMS